jgi:hypothetical protein
MREIFIMLTVDERDIHYAYCSVSLKKTETKSVNFGDFAAEFEV